MNSNFGSSSDSNWNSKLEAKWAQMKREDEESDEEVQVRRNKQNRAAAMVAAIMCQPTEEQPQWGGSIAILGHSPLFNNLTEGKAPQLDYYINNRQYNMGYYLADDIYPKWATLVQAIPNPRNDAEKLFTLHQEAYRKDVERAFDGYIDGEFDDDQEDSNRSRRARAKIYDGPNLPFNPRTGSISINDYMRYKIIKLIFYLSCIGLPMCVYPDQLVILTSAYRCSSFIIRSSPNDPLDQQSQQIHTSNRSSKLSPKSP
ncbi:hypothetical protein D8674_021981 [Pyrus ussuriensis x Pyrus communis]|uniref:Uncharacterized protein n=1 Tax=Pyrus ussuriensis x Pyrus communis TaxID=2448454 RepID=A0A5N5GKR3_9ROSA|nr:hypothetical protein D8674_021981 [Pyrus ussuriensis x Pyrus communis]